MTGAIGIIVMCPTPEDNRFFANDYSTVLNSHASVGQQPIAAYDAGKK